MHLANCLPPFRSLFSRPRLLEPSPDDLILSGAKGYLLLYTPRAFCSPILSTSSSVEDWLVYFSLDRLL